MRALFFLAIVSLSSGCSVERFVRNNVVPDCPGRSDKATSRAAACMAAAMYDIAHEKDETSEDDTTASKDEGDDPGSGEQSPDTQSVPPGPQ